MTRKPNHYAVLGVSATATPDEIKAAFRTLARRYHPDHNLNMPAVEDVFKQVSEAYSVLSDPETRTKYDEERGGATATPPGTTPRFHTPDGEILVAGTQVGRGSDGAVVGVAGHPDLVMKLYYASKITPQSQAKIQTMVANKPLHRTVRDKQSGEPVPALAWPEDAVLLDGQVCGFTMRAIDMSRAVEIHNVESRFARDARPWTQALNLTFRAGIALNLAFLIHQLHASGVVVGDLNERSAVVSSSLIVSLVDCDGMQIRDANGVVFPCTVFQSGFFAPELIGKDLRKTVRLPSSDLFAIAVHVYSLLLDKHPFRNGVYTGPGEKPVNDILAKQGQWRGRRNGFLQIEKSAPEIETILPAELVDLFRRAFEGGASNPEARPGTSEWIASLQSFLNSQRKLQTTPAASGHAGNAPGWGRAQQAPRS